MGKIPCGVKISPGCVTNNVGNLCETPIPPTSCGPDPMGAPCQENHTLEINNYLYRIAVATGADFVIPSCTQTAVVYLPGVTLAHIGSYLWNDIYGYYEIVAFNANTQEVTIRNNCTDGNTGAGTTVEKCTTFIVTPNPDDLIGDSVIYLTADFIVPSIGNCVSIAVTDTSKFLVATSVEIAEGQYSIFSIDSANSMTVCNAGLGGIPGTTVDAINSQGGYNYIITIVDASSAVNGGASFPGAVINNTSNSFNLNTSILITNNSQYKPATVFYIATAYCNGDMVDANTYDAGIRMLLQESINAAPYVTTGDQSQNLYAAADAPTPFSKQVLYAGSTTIAPGASTTIEASITFTWEGSAVGGEYQADLDLLLNALITY